MKLNFSIMVIFYSLYTNMNLLPLTETCLSRALNVTCHLTKSVLLCWLKVMFNFHNLFINNRSVSQETNPHTSYLLLEKKKKLIAFTSIAKASHLGKKKLSDCFSQFKLNWNAFLWNSVWMCYGRWSCFSIVRMGLAWRNANLLSDFHFSVKFLSSFFFAF